MEIRQEQPGDHSAVAHLHRKAFGDEGPQVADLVAGLRTTIIDRRGLSLVAAERTGEIVGHVMFTRGRLDALPRLMDVQILSPLGVAPDHQRKGIGAALVRRGLAEMAEWAVPVVFLEGSPAYYPRFGFQSGAEHGFRKPSLRIPDAAFQVLLLPTWEPWMTGTLVYPDVFWNHDAVGLRDPSE